MKRLARLLLLPAVVAAAQACSSTPPEVRVVEDVAEAMGGTEALRAIRRISVEGSGTGYQLGQARSPKDRSLGGDGTYRSQMDLAAHRFRTEVSHKALGVAIASVAALDGDVAFNIGGFGPPMPVRVGGVAARARQADYYHHPVALLQAALSEDTTVKATIGPVRREEGQDVVPIVTPEGVEVSLRVDPATKLPRAITSMTYSAFLGNAEQSTSFGDWSDSGGIKVPRSITQTLAGVPTGRWTVTHTINGTVEDLAAPANVAVIAPPAQRPSNVVARPLADGVWHLTGAGHHSVVVEFPSYAVLVEAPTDDARTLAVISEARKLVPDKPLKYVVNTHHHFDHSGGIRAAVSEGLTVITHEINKALYTEVVARSHSLSPDRLETDRRSLMIETVTGDEVYGLRDGDRSIQIMRVIDDPHVDGMLIVYLPAEQILIEADDYTPGPTAGFRAALEGPFATALLNTVRRHKLRVARIVPIHGDVVPFSALEARVRDEGMAGR